jgi:hypothetical protein
VEQTLITDMDSSSSPDGANAPLPYWP